MCGITAYFARESVPDFKVIDTLFKGMMKRGMDGFGVCWIHNDKKAGRKIKLVHKSAKNYTDQENIDLVKNNIYPQMNIGDVLIAIQRAAPETEGATDSKRIQETMQPIWIEEDGLCCIHNGAVSNRIHRELQEWAKISGEYKFKTEIDSESIIAAYCKYKRNMKNAMEYLSGGFALIMYDQQKDSLIVVNDHMQIAHGYIRGLGFMLHSDNDIIGEVIQDVTGMNRDGVFLWESHYHHFLDGGAIREIDLQSGFMSKTKYTPRYIVGNTFDSSVKVNE
jgi:glucosamine 6-phosphate synthetase-like amidotransferase/phosphosugar isomerase protein